MINDKYAFSLHQIITKDMVQSSNNNMSRWSRAFQLENLFRSSNFKNFRTYSIFIPFFLLLPLAYLLRDLFRMGQADTLVLKRLNLDILPLHEMNSPLFITVVGLEIVLLLSAVFMSVYFILFVRSIDIEDPFKNERSKTYITRVAVLGVFILLLDLIIRLALQYMETGQAGSISLLNFEYIIMVNFILFFATLFKKGVDLKNEINLVV